MAAGGGESPHPPQSSWGSGPRPPTRALTCAVRCGAPSGRAAPSRAALPLRAPPRGVARAGASPRRRGSAPECPQANNSLPEPLPPDCESSPPVGPRAPQDRTLAFTFYLPLPIRGRQAVPGATPISLPTDSAQAVALNPCRPPLGHRAPNPHPHIPAKELWVDSGNLLLRAVGHDDLQPLNWACFGSSYCCV